MNLTTRVILSALILILTLIVLSVYEASYSPVSGVTHAAQFDDTAQSYLVAKAVRENYFDRSLGFVAGLLLCFIWIPYFLKRNRTGALLLLLGATFYVSSCTPYKTIDYVEVKPNETAWAIPLDAMSQSGQVKFNSVDFLNQKKIPAKRIAIDKVPRSTGRMWTDVEWMPAIRVIVVDRSLVTREWTDGDNGTSKRNEGIGVVTKDSVKLRVGLTITASIDEDDASTYLYYHGARTLADVLDQNVRSYAVSELTKEYSQLALSDAQTSTQQIYEKLFQDAKETFKHKGVTLQYLGNAEGLTYADPKVQEAINRRYLAEQDARTAVEEQNAQKVRNATQILNAQAQADAAQKLFAAREASTFQNDLQIRMINAEANKAVATKWNGQMPSNILPANSPLLMGLGDHTNNK